MQAKHSTARPFACEYCSATYATAPALYGHRIRKHNVNKSGEFVAKKMFPCDLCGKMLTSNTKLTNHVRIIHEGAKDFVCGFCKKQFTSRSNLQVEI